jgi:hypothetical protein
MLGSIRKIRIAAVALTMASTLAATAVMGQEANPAAPTAATATAAAQPEEQLEELAEIEVRGKRLRDEIADAEDDFYQLFNQVNKDDDYDTKCVNLQLENNSRITTRTCIPGFVADAMVDWQVFKAQCNPPYEGFDEFTCLDRNKDNRINWNEASMRPSLESQFMEFDANKDSYLSRQEIYDVGGIPQGAAAYQPPPPQLVLMEGSAKWAQAMKKVIDSDPRLLEQAGRLDELYTELARVSQKYVKVMADGQPDPTTRRELGPRAR